MPVKLVECFNWSAPNKSGELLKYAKRLAKDRVNMDALWAYVDQNGEAKIAAIGKAPAKLRGSLRKLGVNAHVSKCFHISGKDKAGALLGILKSLADAGVNVECSDALAISGNFAATLWVKESDIARTKKILGAH